MNNPTTIIVKVHSARQLHTPNFNIRLVPYVELCMGDLIQKTETDSVGSTEPCWGTTFNFSYLNQTCLRIRVISEGSTAFDYLGQANVILAPLIYSSRYLDTEVQLLQQDGVTPAGYLSITIDMYPKITNKSEPPVGSNASNMTIPSIDLSLPEKKAPVPSVNVDELVKQISSWGINNTTETVTREETAEDALRNLSLSLPPNVATCNDIVPDAMNITRPLTNALLPGASMSKFNIATPASTTPIPTLAEIMSLTQPSNSKSNQSDIDFVNAFDPKSPAGEAPVQKFNDSDFDALSGKKKPQSPVIEPGFSPDMLNALNPSLKPVQKAQSPNAKAPSTKVTAATANVQNRNLMNAKSNVNMGAKQQMIQPKVMNMHPKNVNARPMMKGALLPKQQGAVVNMQRPPQQMQPKMNQQQVNAQGMQPKNIPQRPPGQAPLRPASNAGRPGHAPGQRAQASPAPAMSGSQRPMPQQMQQRPMPHGGVQNSQQKYSAPPPQSQQNMNRQPPMNVQPQVLQRPPPPGQPSRPLQR